MEDQQILTLFWERNADATVVCSQKYGGYCHRVADNILGDLQDAEECVNDTWLQAWNTIPPQKPQVLRMFLAKITRNLAIDRLRKRRAEKRGGGELALVLDELAQCIPDETDVEQETEMRELGTLICRFTEGLPRREGDVWIRRYFFTEPVAVIAARYGLTENHVAVMLSRTRKKLRETLIREGYCHEPK